MSLFTPKGIDHLYYLDRARFLLIWRLSLWFAVTLSIMTITFAIVDDTTAFISYIIGLALSAIGLLYLKATKKYKPIFIIYTLIGSIIVHIDLNTIHDSHHYSNFLWMIILAVMAFYGLGAKWGIIIISFNAFASIYFILFNLNQHYRSIADAPYDSNYLLIMEIFFAMSLGTYLTWLSIKAQSYARLELEETNEKLEKHNKDIVKRDEEKTVLVKEIHHRVKNNLQIIISLLRLQMTEVKSHEAKTHFSEAINRVMVMSSIHQKLYRQKDIANFDLQSYIEELAKELKDFFKEEFPIDIRIKTNINDIDLKTVVPLGLILNELLSNSFKYAFEEKESGEINLQIDDRMDHFIMTYSDNGIWKKDPDSNGFGVELIDLLTEQLNGKKEFITNETGTSYQFELKKVID